MRVGEQHVLALPNSAGRKVAAAEGLRELGGVGSFDLDLAFDRDIAQDRVVNEVPEVLLGAAEIARDVHVVIDRKPLGAPAQGGVGKGVSVRCGRSGADDLAC